MMEPSLSPATSPSTPPPLPTPSKARDDLPALFSRMEEAVAALEPSPHSSPARLRDQQDRHDSDDDMEQEEERLLDSSEKLRTLMMMRRGEGQGYDDRPSAKSSSLGPDAEEPRQLVFEIADTGSSPLRLAPALDIDASQSLSSSSSPSSSSPGYATPLLDSATTTAQSSSLSPTRNDTTSSPSSTPAQLQFWDCNDQGEGTPSSPTRTSGFRTPAAMNTPGRVSVKQEEEEDGEGNRALYRTSSAFALPSAGEEDVEVLNDVVVKEGNAGGESSSSSSSSAGIARTQASSITATAIIHSLAAVIGSLPPAPSTKARSAWGEEEKDMHEVGCASRCLSEVSIQQRFCGLRGIASGGEENDKSSTFSSSTAALASSALCRHLALVTLRPDVPYGEIVDLVTEVVREQGLKIRKRQGSHIIADVSVVGNDGKGNNSGLSGLQAEWSSVDMQVALDRQDKERVLLVRFIISTATEETGCGNGSRKIMTHSRGSRASGGGARGGRGGDGQQPGTRGLLEALKAKLFAVAVNKRALLRDSDDNTNTSSSSSRKGLTLDPQYLNQLEDLAREDMHRTLEGTARNLEEYVAAAEEKCEQLRLLMEPMYLQYTLESPPSIAKPLPLSYYPLDLLAAYDKTKRGEERIGAEEKAGSVDRMGCMDALKEKAWRGFLTQCDAEMTARMQRKNLQVLDRMTKCTEYQRLLIEKLRDNRQRTSVPLFQTFKNQIGHDGGIYEDADVETPLYYCRCIVGSRPATLFITYEHLVFVSSVPGFGWSRRIRFDEILTCGLASMRLGIRVAKAIAVQASTAVVASPMPVKRAGGASGTAVPSSSISSSTGSSSAAFVTSKGKEESLVFSTMIEPERLLDLVKLLISLNYGNAKDVVAVGSAAASALKQERSQQQFATSLARDLQAASPFWVI